MFPIQTQVLEEVADNRIQVTQRAFPGPTNDEAPTAVSTHQRTDFANSPIAENDLTRVLVFKGFQGLDDLIIST
jgi:hypothetical protein